MSERGFAMPIRDYCIHCKTVVEVYLHQGCGVTIWRCVECDRITDMDFDEEDDRD